MAIYIVFCGTYNNISSISCIQTMVCMEVWRMIELFLIFWLIIVPLVVIFGVSVLLFEWGMS